MSTQHAVPEGYEERSGDLVGFWNGEGGLHFIPRAARLTDSKIDTLKSSILIVGELVESSELVYKKERIVGTKGDRIGVWATPGMRALEGCANIPVYIHEDGEIDTGKPNPMKIYRVHAKARAVGERLRVENDFRKDSRQSKLALPNLVFPHSQTSGKAGKAEAEDDDTPF